MNKRSKQILWLSTAFVIFAASGCGPGQFLGPTITPSPTLTLTPTITPSTTPTPTLTPTRTPTPTITPSPTSSCLLDGKWSGQGIAFEISTCTITKATHLLTGGGHFYGILRYDQIPIVDNKFNFSKTEGNGNYIFSGEFDSNVHAFGKVTLPKGYSVGTGTLIQDVTFNWEASPEK